MSKLKISQKVENQLRGILQALQQGQAYLREEKVAVGWMEPLHPNVKTPRGDQFHDCRMKPGMTFTAFDKEIGSKLCYLHNGIRSLQILLDGEPDYENYFTKPLSAPEPEPEAEPSYDW